MTEPQVFNVHRAVLPLEAGPLDYETTHTQAINAHWAEELTRKPALWDGRVHFLRDLEVTDGTLRAAACAARFATLIHWRDQGFPDIGWRHVFGAAVLRASDGAFLMARMAEHTSNAGWVYFPGGAMDEDDVVDGHLDHAGNILREFREETGLDPASVTFAPNFRVVALSYAVAITRTVHLPWPAEEARANLQAGIAHASDNELSEVLIVRGPEDLAGLRVKDYARALVEAAHR